MHDYGVSFLLLLVNTVIKSTNHEENTTNKHEHNEETPKNKQTRRRKKTEADVVNSIRRRCRERKLKFQEDKTANFEGC